MRYGENLSAPDAYVNELDEEALAALPTDVQEMIYQRAVGLSARERAQEFEHDRPSKRQRASDSARLRQMASEVDRQVRDDIHRYFDDEQDASLYAYIWRGPSIEPMPTYAAMQELVGEPRARGAMVQQEVRYVRDFVRERQIEENLREHERNAGRALEDFSFADRLMFAGLARTDPQSLPDIGIRREYGNYDPAWDDPTVVWPNVQFP